MSRKDNGKKAANGRWAVMTIDDLDRVHETASAEVASLKHLIDTMKNDRCSEMVMDAATKFKRAITEFKAGLRAANEGYARRKDEMELADFPIGREEDGTPRKSDDTERHG